MNPINRWKINRWCFAFDRGFYLLIRNERCLYAQFVIIKFWFMGYGIFNLSSEGVSNGVLLHSSFNNTCWSHIIRSGTLFSIKHLQLIKCHGRGAFSYAHYEANNNLTISFPLSEAILKSDQLEIRCQRYDICARNSYCEV